MARYQVPGVQSTFARFSDVARNLGKENDTFGKGSIVLPPAIISYREAWKRYRSMAHDVLDGLTPRERSQWEIVAEFIDDDVRTILIARSMRRLIEKLLATDSKEIQVVEAGFGTGFLAAVALSIDERVKVVGYDVQPAKVSVARKVCEDFGFGNERFLFQSKLVDDEVGNATKSDVLVVAEHISAGLMHELSTDIPRRFTDIPATSCIPYAVHPQLFVTGNGFATVLTGETIVLADRNSPDHVSISGKLSIPSSYNGALKVANGVTWSGIDVPGSQPVQQKDTRGFRIDGLRNHLLRPTCLHADANREVNSFWHIRNLSDANVETDITVTYPVGFLVNKKGIPQVSITERSNVTVFAGPIDERAFAQYVAGMKRGE